MKVPIESSDEFTPERDGGAADEQAGDALEPEMADERESEPEVLDEEAMVEAAKRAGEVAAAEDLKADAERAREETGDLLVKLAAAEDAVAEAKKEASEATDRLIRLQADWENFRRRTAAERLAERERAAEGLVVSLLPVLDDMERAIDHASLASSTDGAEDQFDQFVAGVTAVHDKMLQVLSKEGVEVVDPIGEPFDPLVHQAVGRVEDKEAYEDTVAQVYQRGYSMAGKSIRTAMVTVTYGGPARPVEGDGE